jgi:hypothetical protein
MYKMGDQKDTGPPIIKSKYYFLKEKKKKKCTYLGV